MIKTESNKRSPLRIFEKSIHGGLGKGNIGVITARKGTGKTACLVHIATDQLFLGKHVIHVSFSENINHIISWYEDLFQQIAEKFKLEDAMNVHDEIIKNRIIMNFNQNGTKPGQITSSIRSMIKDGNFDANTIIIDGFDFNKSGKENIQEIKKIAEELGLEIWFSVSLTDSELMNLGDKEIPGKLNNIIDLISVVISLKPKEKYIQLQLVKDHDIIPNTDLHLELDPKTLLIVESK